MSQPEFTEEELRQLEAEMERITVDDVLIQTTVTLLNLAARKAGLGAPAGAEAAAADWEQVRQAIEGARALLPLLESRHAEQLGPVRDTLSRLQMVYAQQAGGAAPRRPPEQRRRRSRAQPRRARRARGRRRAPAGSGSRASSVARSACRLDKLRAAPAAARLRPPLSCLSERFLERVPLSDFLADHGVVVALICALAAVGYGLVTSRSLLALSPGNEVMRGLSAAIQEGASAYLAPPVPNDRDRRRRPLRRADPAAEHRGRDRLPDRRARLGVRRLHRHERVRARQRPRGRGGPRRHRPGARRRVPRRRRHRHARRRPRAARRRRLLRRPDVDLRRRHRRTPSTRSSASASAAR